MQMFLASPAVLSSHDKPEKMKSLERYDTFTATANRGGSNAEKGATP